MLMAAGAVVLAVGVWWGVVADSDDGPTRERSTATPARIGDELDLIPGCTISSCQVLDRRGGFRFDGVTATLAVVGRPQDCQGLPATSVHLVADNAVLWSSPPDLVCGDPISGIEVDRSGNALLVFEAVAEDAGESQALVLRFRGDTVDDFGSFDGRFRGTRVTTRDVDDDGLFEILIDGEQFRWDGEGYEAS